MEGIARYEMCYPRNSRNLEMENVYFLYNLFLPQSGQQTTANIILWSPFLGALKSHAIPKACKFMPFETYNLR